MRNITSFSGQSINATSNLGGFGSPIGGTQTGGTSNNRFGTNIGSNSFFGATVPAVSGGFASSFGASSGTSFTNTFPSFGAHQNTASVSGTTGFSFGNQSTGSRKAAYTVTKNADKDNILSLSAMPVYSSKSHEELRFEDYNAGDRGGSAKKFSSFSTFATQTPSTPFFTQNTSSLFSPQTTTNSKFPQTSFAFSPQTSLSPFTNQTTPSLTSQTSVNPFATSFNGFSTQTSSSLFSPQTSSFFSTQSNSNSNASNTSSIFSPQTSFGPFSNQTTPSIFSPQTSPSIFSNKTTSNSNPPQTSSLFSPQTSFNSFSNQTGPSFLTPQTTSNSNPPQTSSLFSPQTSFNPFSNQTSPSFLTPQTTSNSNPPQTSSLFSPQTSFNSFSTQTGPSFLTPQTTFNLNPPQTSSLFSPQTSFNSFLTQTTSSLFPPQTSPSLFSNQTNSNSNPPQTSSLFSPQTSFSPVSDQTPQKIQFPQINATTFAPTTSFSPSPFTISPHNPATNGVSAPQVHFPTNPWQSTQTVPTTSLQPSTVTPSTSSQGSAPQSTGVVQPVINSNPFGELPAMNRLSVSQPGSTILVRHGISSMPVRDKALAPVKLLSSLTTRHLSHHPMRLPARKYDSKRDTLKVPFFKAEEESPVRASTLVPRENPRAFIALSAELWPHKYETEEASPGESSENNTNKEPNNAININLEIYEPDPHKTKISQECIDKIMSLMPQLSLPDYYTEPTIKQLAEKEMEEPGFCSRVKEFEIGRYGYGNIKFLGETDVRSLSLDSLIEFGSREVIVYKDESEKPPVGKGLNKAAEVTLLNIQCVDKKSGKKFVEGPKVEKYKEMLMKKGEEQGAEFVSFDPVKGEWKFRVQHF